MKLSCKTEESIKTFSGKTNKQPSLPKLREFIARRPVLQETLKRILQAEFDIDQEFWYKAVRASANEKWI